MLNNDVNVMLTDVNSKDDAKLMLKHDAKEMLVDAKPQSDAKVMLITDAKHANENKLASSSKNHRKQKGCGVDKEYEEVKRINTKQNLEEEKHPNKV